MCISASDTFEEAVTGAAWAVAGHLAIMKADSDAAPLPRNFEELQRDPGFRDDSTGAIVTMVVTPPQAMAAE